MAKLRQGLRGAASAAAGLVLVAGCTGESPQNGEPTATREAPLSPPPNVGPGVSTLRGKNVYAPPNEGEIDIPFTLDLSLPGELNIQTPSMVNGSARLHIKYSRSKNTVDFDATFHGLPFRQTFTKDFDDSTAFNPQFVTVKDAHWQMWLMGTLFGRQHEDLYYDLTTPGKLPFLGTVYDFQPIGPKPFPAPGTYTTVKGNALQMVCSPEFEGKPNGEGHLHFTLQYDRIADAAGTPGTINLILPLDACKPDALSNYWTQAELPPSKFMTWDTYLESIWSGEGIGFVTTAEPFPRPPELAFRDNDFVGWGNVYPGTVPSGFGMDFRTFGTIIPIHGSTYQLAPWPATSRRNLCGGS
jgi:hypothetical protein